MENGALSPSDVALLNNDGFGGGNSFMWIFGLLILMSMLNGGLGGYNRGYQPQYATQTDVQYTSQFGQLLDGNRDIIMQANGNTNNIIGAITNAEYETVASMKDAQLQLQDRLSTLNVGQSQLLANQNQCCCNTRLELANSKAEIMAHTDAKFDRIMETINRNKIEEMQNEINRLQLAQATAGMLRFPNTWTFNGGYFPPVTPATTSTTTG